MKSKKILQLEKELFGIAFRRGRIKQISYPIVPEVWHQVLSEIYHELIGSNEEEKGIGENLEKILNRNWVKDDIRGRAGLGNEEKKVRL